MRRERGEAERGEGREVVDNVNNKGWNLTLTMMVNLTTYHSLRREKREILCTVR